MGDHLRMSFKNWTKQLSQIRGDIYPVISNSKNLISVSYNVCKMYQNLREKVASCKVCVPDVEIVGQPGSLAARNFLSWQK